MFDCGGSSFNASFDIKDQTHVISNVTNFFGGKAMADNYSAVKRPINGQNQSIEA